MKDTRSPIVKGSPDPDMPGCLLVPIQQPHRSFPRVGLVPKTTFYRYHVRRHRVVAMLSVTESGLSIAWDWCSGCSNYLTRCTCTNGLTSSEWLRSQCGATTEPPKPQSSLTMPPRPKATVTPSPLTLPSKPKLTSPRPSADHNGEQPTLPLPDFSKLGDTARKTTAASIARLIGRSSKK
jgi:hypothetical protein